jgi:hypothetical protein
MFGLSLAAPLWFGGAGGSWTLAQARRGLTMAARAGMVGTAAGAAAGAALSSRAGPRPVWDARSEPRRETTGDGGGYGAPLSRRESGVIDVDANEVTFAPLLPRPRAALPWPAPPQLPDADRE